MKKVLLFFILINLAFASRGDFLDDEFETPIQRQDPLSGYNRAMTDFNDFMYIHAFNPLSKSYETVIPKEIRICIYNFFDNLASPIRFLNNLLQGKFKNSGDELFRFVVNSTLGVGGLGDAGDKLFGIKKHEEDFGQTLAFYGIKSGYSIVLPFLGPSNLRDSIGFVGDYFTFPISYIKNQKLGLGLNAYNRLNTASFHNGEYEQIKKNAFDLYPYLQDLYEEKRKIEIKK